MMFGGSMCSSCLASRRTKRRRSNDVSGARRPLVQPQGGWRGRGRRWPANLLLNTARKDMWSLTSGGLVISFWAPKEQGVARHMSLGPPVSCLPYLAVWTSNPSSKKCHRDFALVQSYRKESICNIESFGEARPEHQLNKKHEHEQITSIPRINLS